MTKQQDYDNRLNAGFAILSGRDQDLRLDGLPAGDSNGSDYEIEYELEDNYEPFDEDDDLE